MSMRVFRGTEPGYLQARFQMLSRRAGGVNGAKWQQVPAFPFLGRFGIFQQARKPGRHPKTELLRLQKHSPLGPMKAAEQVRGEIRSMQI